MRLSASTLLVIALLAGCSGKEEEKKPTGKPKPSTTTTRDGKPVVVSADKDKQANKDGGKQPAPLGPPEFMLTTRQLAEEAEKDYSVLEKKYQGRVLELTGPVVTVGHYEDEEPFLALERLPTSDTMRLYLRDASQWTKAMRGQTVKVRGRLSDRRPLSELEGAEIVEVTGDRPPSYSADQIAETYAKQESGKTGYDRKPIQVTGEIAAIEFDRVGYPDVFVTLKTAAPMPQVICGVQVPVRSRLKKQLKVGQKVRMWVKEVYGDRKTVHLSQCALYEVRP
jgi:hypothetical protein